MLDGQRVSLNLESLLEGVSNDLDAARLVLLLSTAANTTENSASVVHQHYLLKAVLLLKLGDLIFIRLTLMKLTEASKRISRIDQMLRAGLLGLVRCQAREIHAFNLVLPSGFVVLGAVAQLPYVDRGVPTGGDEAGIVIEPSDASDHTVVTLEDLWVLRVVELVYINQR